jgi:hypothetical protein
MHQEYIESKKYRANDELDEDDIEMLDYLKKIQAEKKFTKPTEDNSTITLCIQGHGQEYIHKMLTQNVKFNVNVLTFGGKLGVETDFRMCYDGSIDTKVMNKLNLLYSSRRATKLSKTLMFETLPEYFYRLYADQQLYYPSGAFQIIYPKIQKVFQLRPKCGEDERLCPEYGISVVSSSDPADNGFTLETIPHKKGEGYRRANINMNGAAFEHWYEKSKMETYVKDQVREIIFDEKVVHLSDIILFFKSMGFKHINIIDPSCRFLEEHVPKLKLAAFDILSTIKTKLKKGGTMKKNKNKTKMNKKRTYKNE